MECKKCGSKWVVNKTYCLCETCNHFRIHGMTRLERNLEKESKKMIKDPLTKKSRLKTRKTSVKKRVTKSKLTLQKDEETYESVFNKKPHECENCKTPLPDQFRDSEGKVIARFQYSHIVGKARVPHLRHMVSNFNRLCLKCHTIWDFGTQKERESMIIWEDNLDLFSKYLIKYY